MTAITAAFGRKSLTPGKRSYPVKAGEVIPQGGLVGLDSNRYAVNLTDATSTVCAGVAYESKTGGSASGDVSIEVESGKDFRFAFTSITLAMLGAAMYAVDNNTLDDAAGATNDVFVGILTRYISTTEGEVFIPGLAAYPTSGVTATPSELNQLAGSAGGLLQSVERTFTETSGAGTYTGAVTLPAGATIHDIIVNGVALWDNAGTVTMKVGDTDDDGYYTAINLKATDLLAGESLSFALAGGKAGAYIANSQVSPRYNAGAVTINGIITTSSTGGSAGRTRMVVIYSVPTSGAATKV